MKELWDDKGYENLRLTGQNLRDQASRLQKLRDCCTENLSSNEIEENDSNNYNDAQNATSQPRPTPNLHTRGKISYEHFCNDINEIYDEIVHFRKKKHFLYTFW